ncbi:hypothetical protein [Streptomyces sp. MMG1533]|uniref:hypothetical protein n=1 Tax=Streptomyces sp. MMG1533 TaxID=1415546 RepID=UPI0006AE7DE4|nr:hypothetical protein [Streptomyces sp. MMG1533]
MAVVGVAVSLAVAGWLIWLLPGAPLAAVLGLGPVDGVMTIAECHEAHDVEGNADGTDCTGRYTPRRAGEPSRAIVLNMAAKEHRPGSTVEVRTARGQAYEPSAVAVVSIGTITGLVLLPFLILSLWLFACARHGRWVNGEGYVFLALGGLFSVIVLGIVVGLLVEIGVWVFGG